MSNKKTQKKEVIDTENFQAQYQVKAPLTIHIEHEANLSVIKTALNRIAVEDPNNVPAINDFIMNLIIALGEDNFIANVYPKVQNHHHNVMIDKEDKIMRTLNSETNI
jgi:hypothetical protein